MARSESSLNLKRWCTAALLAPLVFACHVDERRLSPTNGGDTGGGGAGSLGGGSGRVCEETTDASVGGKVSKSVCSKGICPDLNDNYLGDDTETLVENPTFSQEMQVQGWQGELGVSSGWFQGDACGRGVSGSISLPGIFAGPTGIHALKGARQCLSAASGQTYSLTADVQPDATALAGVGLVFFASEDCTGDPLSRNSFSSKLVASIGDWQTTTVTGEASSEARSVAARLIVGAPAPPPNNIANALFDNVLLLEL